MYRNIILPVVLHGFETLSLILSEEHTQRVFENSVLRKVFWPMRNEVTGSGGDCIMRSFVICTAHHTGLPFV
jgi:hypothetical protein